MEVGSNTVNKLCQQIMTHCLKIMIASIKTRRKTEYTSYKIKVWIFLCSKRFRKIAETTLAKSMHVAKYCQGCLVIAMCLNRTMERMTRESMTAALMHHSPELFKRPVGNDLSPAEKNGEVNRFMGWSIFSAQQKFEQKQPEFKILEAMHCKLDNLSK